MVAPGMAANAKQCQRSLQGNAAVVTALRETRQRYVAEETLKSAQKTQETSDQCATDYRYI